MSDDLPPLPTLKPGRYRHHKGLDYEVLGVVRHSETLEPMVLYRPLYCDHGDWVRPYAMFTGEVTVGGVCQPRFAWVEPAAADTTPRYRQALPEDVPACITLRGQTRENAISEARLREVGITAESWGGSVRDGTLLGHLCTVGDTLVGYAFGSCVDGEVVVLALLPTFEGQGLGRELLGRVVRDLVARGHKRLHLGCSADPSSRSHGFYRHLGWRSTGQLDAHGDEILEWSPT